MTFSWIEEPASCNGCQLAGLAENGRWGRSPSGRFYQSTEQLQFNYLTINTWEGQYTGVVPKDFSMMALDLTLLTRR